MIKTSTDLPPSEFRVNFLDMIAIMEMHKKYLTPSQLKFVRDIDNTVSEFDDPTQLAVRQHKVIEGIYQKYRQSGGTIR